ncbi:hypothetical protein [Streptomyces sp. CB01881]|uniref:hypothetical protein n=1 Tax=Streptomyces sp. CB01881 TaxID=2078691 RepID=UPI0019D60570|nr:hypothetical protein [Streptomyces sp. CB01881]
MPDAGRFSELGEQGSQAVMEAAAVLERELAAGLADAKATGDRLTGEHRVDPEEFGRLVQRVSENTHQLIDAVSDRLLGNTGGEAAEHTQRLAANAHDVLDLLLNLSTLAPGFANRSMQETFGPRQSPAEHPGGAEGHQG